MKSETQKKTALEEWSEEIQQRESVRMRETQMRERERGRTRHRGRENKA